MNILSLFDGMSCGQIAINRPGIKYDNYFASEIDNYTNHVSDSQRYRMLGNGWTVDVIVHILKYLKHKNNDTKY